MSNTYLVTGVYKSLVGDGHQAGMKSAFVGFTNCNLWSGKPADRGRGEGACSRWCHSEFSRGEPLSTSELLAALDAVWPRGEDQRWVRLTGGEPMLQVDKDLLWALHDTNWRVALETNGTIDVAEILDITKEDAKVQHLVVSPKLGSTLKVKQAHELKVVLPGAIPPDPGWTDEALEAIAADGLWRHRYVLPQDPIDPKTTRDSFMVNLGSRPDLAGIYKLHLGRAVAFVDRHPDWRLAIESNKHVGVP